MSDKTTASLTESVRASFERGGDDAALARFEEWVIETNRQLTALANKWGLS